MALKVQRLFEAGASAAAARLPGKGHCTHIAAATRHLGLHKSLARKEMEGRCALFSSAGCRCWATIAPQMIYVVYPFADKPAKRRMPCFCGPSLRQSSCKVIVVRHAVVSWDLAESHGCLRRLLTEKLLQWRRAFTGYVGRAAG